MPTEAEIEKKRTYHREYYHKNKASFRKKTKCKVCGKMVAHDHQNRHKKSAFHRSKVDATVKYKCGPCDKLIYKHNEKRHIESKGHKAKMATD